MDYEPDAQSPRIAYRSKAETQIARLLDREGIPFQYEYPLAVIDRGHVRIWYPDFRLRDYGMIMEYFGMNGNADYRKRAEHKMQVYRQNGIEGVFLTEASFSGDWPRRILGQIEGVLEQRLQRFHDSRDKHLDAENDRVKHSHVYDFRETIGAYTRV